MTAPNAFVPADPHVGTRAKLYAALTALVGLPGLVQLLGVITSDQAASITQILTGVLGLLGGSGLALAAAKSAQQAKAPTVPVPVATPVDDAFAALAKIKQEIDDAVNHAQTQVVQATAMLQGAAAVIPGGAAVTKAVLSGPVGDLVQTMFDRGGLTVPAPGQHQP